MQRILGFLLALALTPYSYGAETVDKPLPTGYLACPNPDQLVRDPKTLQWGAAGGWRTFVVSFSQKIYKFLGAQWEGVNVGNIYCLYQGDKMTFVINLQYPGLAFSPNQGRWGKDLGGYKNCKSTVTKDCPFIPFKKPDDTNPYKDLDSLKTAPMQQYGF